MSEPMQPQPAPVPANPISVVTALADAFTYIIQGFIPLWQLSWRYVAFTCVAAAAFFAAIAWFARAENELAIHILVGVGLLLAFLVSVAYYIVVVRNWLLSEQDPAVRRVYPKFLLRVVLLTLALVAIMAAIFLPAMIGGFALFDYLTPDTDEPSGALVIAGIIALVLVALAAVVFGVYLAGRLTPWFTAAAVGSPLTAAQSWRATKAAGLRILGGMLVLAIAFGIIDITIEQSLSPLLGVTSDAFDLLYKGEKLVSLFVLVLLKIAVYFPQVAASMVYCGSIFRQISRS